MNDTTFGVLTSALTVGGLIGSLIGGGLSDRLGRKGASMLSSLLFLVGSLAMAGAWAYPMLLLGR
jgi:MFS family permease